MSFISDDSNYYKIMKKILLTLIAALCAVSAFAQGQIARWTYQVEKQSEDNYRVVFSANIAKGYHSYSISDEMSPTEIFDAVIEGGELSGKVY